MRCCELPLNSKKSINMLTVNKLDSFLTFRMARVMLWIDGEGVKRRKGIGMGENDLCSILRGLVVFFPTQFPTHTPLMTRVVLVVVVTGYPKIIAVTTKSSCAQGWSLGKWQVLREHFITSTLDSLWSWNSQCPLWESTVCPSFLIFSNSQQRAMGPSSHRLWRGALYFWFGSERLSSLVKEWDKDHGLVDSANSTKQCLVWLPQHL